MLPTLQLPQPPLPFPVALRRPAEGAWTAPLPALPGLRRRALLRGLMASLGRAMEVEGGSYLEGFEEPAVFALNHNNSIESILAPAVLILLRHGRGIHFLTDWMYLHVPLLGALMRLSAPIPVYGKRARFGFGERLRQAGRKDSVVERCVACLQGGRSVGLFPEGRRNRDPFHLLRGRLGLGEVVLRTGSPVVPVGLHYPAARRLGRAPHFGRLIVRIGDPLRFPVEPSLSGEVPPDERQRLVRRIVETTMQSLGRLAEKRPACGEAGLP